MTHPRTRALLVTGLLVVAGAAAATLAFTGAQPVALAQTIDEADHVTLYQNGLAFVQLSRTIRTDGGEAELVLPLPTSARLDSLQVDADGVTVKQVRSGLSDGAPLQPGEQVIVHTTEGQRFVGTFLAFERDAVVLSTGEGMVLVQMHDVSAIEMQGRDAQQLPPGMAEARVLIEAPEGTHKVNVTYLAQGAGWTPSYALDVETGLLTFYATLSPLADWSNVTLDLVSGQPNVVLEPHPREPPIPQQPTFEAGIGEDAAAVRSEAGDDFAGGVPLGDLHRYRYESPIDLSRGEQVRLAVEQGTVDILEQRYDVVARTGWGIVEGARQDAQVHERVEFLNTLDEPLPTGTVNTYRDGTWVGQDRIESTPEGDRANVTLSTAQGVEAELVLAQLERNGTREVQTYRLTVENHRDEPVSVRAQIEFPGREARLLDTSPPADESTGASVTWNVTLEAGAARAFVLRYDVERPR